MTIVTIADEGTLTAAASTTIGPTSSNGQWVIHNLYVDDASTVKLEIGDGTTYTNIGTISSSMLNFYFHLTYTHYFRITNNGGTTISYSYDGVSVV